MTVPNIHDTDSSCEIDVISSFHILGDRAFGRVNELLGNTANATGKVFRPKLAKLFVRFGAHFFVPLFFSD
jgi:hypothetical protein